ncbi:MAG TPA: SpvB/TcaC N-terminal domain-containing protein [Gaiellaceae bacterium]
MAVHDEPTRASDPPRAGAVGGLPSVSLPKGGGAIQGIGEKFSANPATGTGSLTIPVPASPGRSGFGPSLSLSYDSGNGNGPFGFGWSLGLASITRKTDNGLPRYADAAESDVFILSGAEDLVPVLREDGTRWADDSSAPGYVIHRYRPRVEGLFARIERWTHAEGDVHWRSLTRDNVLTLYGKDLESRIADPESPQRVFSWLICETRDDKGNAVVYEYRREDGAGVDVGQAHEQNRDDVGRSANRYLSRIRYANRAPLLSDDGTRPSFLTPAQVDDADWLFELVLDYDEGRVEQVGPDPDVPAAEQLQHIRATPSPAQAWQVRPDPFSSHRAGFEVRTYRRCRRFLMFHHFPALESGEAGYDGLVRMLQLDYADLDYGVPVAVDDELAHQGSTRIASLLRGVTQSGCVLDGAGPQTYIVSSLPALELEYSRPTIRDEVLELDRTSVENLPVGIDGTAYRLVDLDGEGTVGVLTQQDGAWYYKRNRGDGDFGALETVATRPSTADGQEHLLDLSGDGRLDVVTLRGPVAGYSVRTNDADWEPFRAFGSLPNVDWGDPNLRLVDLAGAGHSDVLVAHDDSFSWYPSLAEEGFGPAAAVPHPLDEERGPRLVFADGTQSVYLADMSGDGLADLVRVRNGEVCYWPSLGYARFGAKVSLDNAPRFDHPELFEQSRVRLADIDGSGTSDIVYLGRDAVRLYFNQSGNRLTDARALPPLPHLDDTVSVQTADLLANGTTCLVWSSPAHPLRYVDLMGETKPHLLTRSVDNLGTETEIAYASSTRFYLADMRSGRPWLTRLPFPVHVVERVTVTDRVSGNRFVTRNAYHHGFYDGVERELRGFALVEQWDTATFPTVAANDDESSDVPPVLTKTWFHTGVYAQAAAVSRQLAAEYYGAPPAADPTFAAFLDTLLPDTILPAGLTADEEREACRALKGSMLRREVYSLDGSAREQHPYTVAEQNFTVSTLQHRESNRHAVFFTHARESLTYHYEREPDDPRVAHALTLDVDVFGNVLAAASIGYGRRLLDPELDPADQAKQTQLVATYTENAVTTAVDDAGAYRAAVVCETRTYELTGLTLPGGHDRFAFDEVADAGPAATVLDYEQAPTPGSVEKRLVEHVRTYFRRDDLADVLPLGEQQSLALPFASHRLAFTPGLVTAVYGDRVTDAILSEGGYIHSEGDTSWWVPSGRVFHSPGSGDTAAQELAYARQHFFLSQRRRDPFGAESVVRYDGYDLLVHETTDALGNQVTAGERPAGRRNDYRVLQPALVMDPNRNCVEVRFDALGLVAGTAVMGKPDEGPRPGDRLAGLDADLTPSQIDAFLAAPKGPAAATLLGDATTRVVYDLTASPAVAATLARETHLAETPPAGPAIQVTLAYSDGFGREIQKKVQAEPGAVPGSAATVDPRWVGSGWTIYNNKGKPVRQYEPFFTDRHTFEADAAAGVSPVLLYDPVDRVAATLHPDRTWEKIVIGAWRQETWDANDTSSLDPAADPDVGGLIARLATSEYEPTWSALRTEPANAAAFAARFPDAGDRANETRAAQKTLVHAETPAVAHTDALGRAVLTVTHNAYRYSDAAPDAPPTVELHRTRVDLDVEGNRLRLRDAMTTAGDDLGRIVVVDDYDVAGNRIHEASMEGGERWLLNDVGGSPLYAWDSLGRRFRTAYDALRRPTDSFLQEGGGAETTIGRSIYGEGRPSPESTNSRGKLVELRDQSGLVTSVAFDFKGNLLQRGRRLTQAYSTTIDWAAAVPLEPETYTSRTRYDALNRATQVVPPHSDEAGAAVNVIQTTYNAANLLERIDVWLDEAAEPVDTLDPATASLRAVTGVDYDAKGRRLRIDRGTSDGHVIRTTHAYDPQSFRLTRISTRRGIDPAAPQDDDFADALQYLRYTYDASGNVVQLRDDAQQTVFFRNRRVEPSCDYTYDAEYRLIEATGREHLGQVGGVPIPGSYDDAGRSRLLHPGDGNAMATYLERYVYDDAGNFASMQHRGTDPANPGWTRSYAYGEASVLEPAKTSNRLTSTTVGGATEVYSNAGDGYDANGCMLRMPQLAALEWSFDRRLRMTQRQAVNADDADGQQHQGERTWYVYDAAGERVRKVTELAGGDVKDERAYLGGVERYRRHGAHPLVRETLHVMDDHQQLVIVETRRDGDEPGAPARTVRNQLGNHLGSATLELDADAQIVSYEEYTPYGSTSYQAVRSQVEAPKRYRFTGRERDEESGLYHHGARYYAPWLGRWTSADPVGVEPDANRFRYCRSSPLMLSDPSGTDPPSDDSHPVRVTPLLTDVAPTGITGDLQFHDLFSADRSVSGRIGLSGHARSGFLLSAPGLGLRTSGFADASGTAALDTSLGRGGVALQGGAVIGGLSDLHLVLRGDAAFRIPIPGQIPLGGLPGSLLADIPRGEGNIHLTGALASGSFTLGTFDAAGSLADGRFRARVGATTFANLGRLRLDASGTVSPQGDVSLESARLSARVRVPGLVGLDVAGTGTATTGGALALRGSADLRLFGLPSLHAEGTGTASTSGADFAGRFYGPGPLYTSYITGNFSVGTRTGISGAAGIFGLTYTPGVTLAGPNPRLPLPPGGATITGGSPSPWTPSGLTLGASYFSYRNGGLSYISGGFIPDLSQRIFTNPRFGVTAQVSF